MGAGGTTYISNCLSDSKFKTSKSRKSWPCLNVKAVSKKNKDLLAKEKEAERLPLRKKNAIDFISF